MLITMATASYLILIVLPETGPYPQLLMLTYKENSFKL